jgi:hypothetical protein
LKPSSHFFSSEPGTGQREQYASAAASTQDAICRRESMGVWEEKKSVENGCHVTTLKLNLHKSHTTPYQSAEFPIPGGCDMTEPEIDSGDLG